MKEMKENQLKKINTKEEAWVYLLVVAMHKE
jgi:hypothetical protein